MAVFADRREAGTALAQQLQAHRQVRDVIVLALPRGGVPVAFEIARALHVPLDLMLVRKLGLPKSQEVAMGAIALDDRQVFNEDIIHQSGVTPAQIDQIVRRERHELNRRNQLYRQSRLGPDLTGKTVILVDDGMATGANMRVAIQMAKRQRPEKIIIAIPMASDQALSSIARLGVEMICLHVPVTFYGVGATYRDFSQTKDAEVLNLLAEARVLGLFSAAEPQPHAA